VRRSACFGGEAKGSAQRYFRAEIPAQALSQYGWRTDVSNYVLTPQTPWELKRDARFRGWDGGNSLIPPRTVMTLRIVDNLVGDPEKGWVDNGVKSMPESIERAREAGQVILCDVDDDLWHIPAWSPTHKSHHPLNRKVRSYDLEAINGNMAAADGVLCSTPYLADIVKEQVPTAVTHVMRPGINPAVYRPRAPHERLRVGWMGGMSHHLPHLRTMQIALDVLEKYDAEFMMLGKIEGDNSEFLLSEIPCAKGTMPWGPIDELPEKLAQVDIGIIPRVPSDFNEGQSVTSGLQYAAAGIPFLVSPSAEYERLANLGAGKICRTIDDWRRELADLLEYEDYRTSEAERAKECVSEAFGLKATGSAYHDLFEELLDGR
jgi:hypothetical protein